MIFLFLMITIILIDQISKNRIKKLIKNKKCIKNRFLKYHYLYNKGFALGIFKRKPKIVKILHTISIIFIAWVFFIFQNKNRVYIPSFGIILGGGISNLIDRYRYNGVFDFFSFSFWKKSPVFNLADISIIVGVVISIIKIGMEGLIWKKIYVD